MRYTLAKADLPGTIDQLAALNRISHAPVERLMAALGGVISSEAQVDEAVAALRPHPVLYEPFLRGFSTAAKPAPLVVRLVRALPRDVVAAGEIRRLAIAQMVRVHAYAEARRLWADAARPDAKDLVHSPDFSDSRRPPPFNWSLVANDTGAAERLPGGGISVDYFGRAPGPLVSQLLTLAPGRYVATLSYRTASGQPGMIGLSAGCADVPVALGEVPLLGKPGTDATVKLGFVVPAAGCEGQMLAVTGRAAEARDAQQTVLVRLDLEREAGQ